MTTTPPPRRRRAYADLFLISFLILFLELACIRWFGSTVIFLTFFTNHVLLACFLGMSVGCLAASRRRDFVHAVLPLLLLAVALAWGILLAYTRLDRVAIDVGAQRSPQQVFFGTEARAPDPGRFVVPIELVAGVFFVLIALIFVGLGQVLGRALAAIPNRVLAYTANILGSLAGIAAFAAASHLRSTPLLWFALGAGLCLYFVPRGRAPQLVAALALLAVVAESSYGWRDLLDRSVYRGLRVEEHDRVLWSPYYKIDYGVRLRTIGVNNIGHQTMIRVAEEAPAYVLPHLLNRDAGGGPFRDVLVIGAGSGNDVQAALVGGATRVDAVEIDPVIYELGRAHHPDRPYDDPRVTVHLDDGRSFLRTTDRSYDLIVYALVDSLVLHSGYSNLRLESFLFTEEAFRDVRARLKPGGVFAMYNFYRQGWVVARIVGLIERVFGAPPVVVSLPHREAIAPEDSQAGAITFVLAGNTEATAVEAIRRALRSQRAFWLYEPPRLHVPINAYGPEPPLESGEPSRIGLARVETAGVADFPTDDWPFLYLRGRIIPALNVRGMLLIGLAALALLLIFAPVRTARPNGAMFFLGAGFMLLETKGVVHMALLFGSTWVVSSVVFAAILVMILLSNVYVLLARPKRLWPYYALLIGALGINAVVPMSVFLGLPGAAKTIASCAVVFVPVFFAGVIFATAFRDSQRPDVDFGSNIGGAILGGLSENLSLIVGFNGLLLVAIGYYLLAMALGPGRGARAAPGA